MNHPLHDGTYLICGMERSGSTFVYQVLKRLGLNVSKSHSHDPAAHKSVKIYTHRDPRDVICSYARTALKPELESGEIDKSIPGVPREDLRCAIYRLFYRPNARQLDYRLFLWEASHGAPIVFIKYEDYFLGNEKELVAGLCTFVSQFESVDASEENIDRILEECSIEANRKRALKLKDFDEWDEDGVHGDHISVGGISTWRDEFDWVTAVCVDRHLGDFLVELGYEKDREWFKKFQGK